MKAEDVVAWAEKNNLPAKAAAIRALLAERDRLREALEIIAGNKQCVDSLLGNADIARLALEHKP